MPQVLRYAAQLIPIPASGDVGPRIVITYITLGIYTMSNFWDFVWLLLMTFVLVAYLMVLFQIIVDLFRDKNLGGFSKAIWFIGLIFLPFLTALIYIIARGRGMSERQVAAFQEARAESEAYIRSIAGGKSAAEQIAEAKALLDSGAISADEFAKLKAKAIG